MSKSLSSNAVLSFFLISQQPVFSAYVRDYAEHLGITVLLNDTAAALHGKDKVQEVETASGRRIPSDLVVAAMGVTPASEFLAGSGIALEDGYIAVDERLRTSAPNVYAAGDVTAFYDPVFARRRHIEHWDNAVKQGRLAALNMLGRRLRYEEVSYFFSDVGDLSFVVLGAPEEGHEWIERGSIDTQSYALFYLKNNVLRALFSMGRQAIASRSRNMKKFVSILRICVSRGCAARSDSGAANAASAHSRAQWSGRL